MNIKNFKGLTGGLVLVSALGLAACGSDDDSTPATSSGPDYTGPTTAVQLSSKVAADDAATAVAGQTVTGDMSASETSDVLAFQKAGASTGLRNDLVGRVVGLVNRALDAEANSTAIPALAGVTQSQTIACGPDASYGTMTLSITYSVQGTLSSGDSISMAFSNCNDGFETTNGSMSITFTTVGSYDGTVSGDMDGVAVTLSANQFKWTDNASGAYELVHGGLTLAIADTDALGTSTEFSLSGTSLYSADGDGAGNNYEHLLTNFDFIDIRDNSTGDLTISYDFTFASTEIDGSVTVDTSATTPFLLYYLDMYPTEGIVTVTGANNASVRLTTIDNANVLLEYDLDGDGVYGNGTDPAPYNTTWSALNT